MTPAARVQAAIELLDAIVEAAGDNGPPADRLIADYFRRRRYAGSKDRRAVRELTYAAIRVCGPAPESGRAAMLRLADTDPAIAPLFDGSTHGPQPIGESELAAAPGIAPAWLAGKLAESGVSGDEAAALLGRAALDLRVNTLKASRGTIELPSRGGDLLVPNGLRFAPGTPVEQWPAYREGLVEVQDLGSQLACLAVGARPGETVIDLCAGAGGKTLTLAAAMENRGVLLGCDTDRARLARLAPRVQRAGAGMIDARLMNPGRELEMLADFAGRADAVLVDAPCSGTGVWRRNPEARWRLDRTQLARYADLQARLLDVGARLVRPGGRLVFVTCSLLDEEGAEQVDRFLARSPGWAAQAPELSLGKPRGKGLRLSPFHDDTDGFFIAQLGSPC